MFYHEQSVIASAGAAASRTPRSPSGDGDRGGVRPRRGDIDRDGGGCMDDRTQEGRKHVFAINSASEFLDIVREVLQEEHYTVTTTTFGPNAFAQIAAVQPDVLIVDVVTG